MKGKVLLYGSAGLSGSGKTTISKGWARAGAHVCLVEVLWRCGTNPSFQGAELWQARPGHQYSSDWICGESAQPAMGIGNYSCNQSLSGYSGWGPRMTDFYRGLCECTARGLWRTDVKGSMLWREPRNSSFYWNWRSLRRTSQRKLFVTPRKKLSRKALPKWLMNWSS